MSFCICGPTAIEFWRHHDNRLPNTPVFGHTPGSGPALSEAFPRNALPHLKNPDDLAADFKRIRTYNLSRWGINTGNSVHILVSRKHRARPSAPFLVHSSSGIHPKGFILVIEGDLCITSPEYTILQAAQYHDEIGLLLLAQEFCGCYSIQRDGQLLMRHPLTSSRMIEDAAEKMADMKGVTKLRKILPLIIDGAGSPRETAVALTMCLPKRYGGYGLPRPVLNKSLDLESGTLIWGKGNAFDLVWEKSRVVIEYDGREAHKSPEQQDRDNARRNALVVAGYSPFVVTEERLRDIGHMYAIAKASADALGFRLVFRDPDFRRKHLALMRRLLSSHR